MRTAHRGLGNDQRLDQPNPAVGERAQIASRSWSSTSSFIFKLRSQARGGPHQSRANARWGYPKGTADLRRIEARDMAERQEQSVIIRESAQGDREVGMVDPRRGVGLDRADVGDLDLHHAMAPLSALGPSCLIGSDRHQPWPKVIGLAERSEFAPRDRPRCLHGILSRVLVATDDEADARHIVVVLGHDVGKGSSVAGRGLRHGHRREPLGVASSCSMSYRGPWTGQVSHRRRPRMLRRADCLDVDHLPG